MAAEASAALASGLAPELVDDGLGGTYFISKRLPGGNEAKICVFKPRDEEPNAINNPKREQQEAKIAVGAPGLKGGIRVGDAALNEWAAYLLDSSPRSARFSRVPPTAIVHVEHSAFFDAQKDGATNACGLRARKTKVGSLQQFVPHDGFAEDFSQSLFSDLEVQRIAVLDVRTFNTDRHAANLLVLRPSSSSSASRVPPAAPSKPSEGETNEPSDDGYRLVPIDHGFCLPAAITVPCFEWAHWPQAKAPMQAEVLAYIAAIDVDADAALLTNGDALPSNAPSCCSSAAGSLAPSPTKSAAPASTASHGFGGVELGGAEPGMAARPSSPLEEPPSHGDNKRPIQDGSFARNEPKLMRPRSVSSPSDPLRAPRSARERLAETESQPRDASPLGQLRAGCVTTLRVGTLMLTKAAEHGLTLSQLADFMCEPASRSQAAALLAADRGGQLRGGEAFLAAGSAGGARGGARPFVRRSLLSPPPKARPSALDADTSAAPPPAGLAAAPAGAGSAPSGLWSASDMRAAAAAAAEAAASRAVAKETLEEAGLEAETERLQRIALMRRDRSYLAIPSAEAEEVEAEAAAEARASAAQAWLHTQGELPGGTSGFMGEVAGALTGLAARRGHGLQVEVRGDGDGDAESDADDARARAGPLGATPLSQAATAEKRCSDRQPKGDGHGSGGGVAGAPDLDAARSVDEAGSVPGLAPAVAKRLSGSVGGADSAYTGCSPVSVFAGCGSQLAEVPDLVGTAGTEAGVAARSDGSSSVAMAEDGGASSAKPTEMAERMLPAPMTIDVSQSCNSSAASSLSNSCTGSSFTAHGVTAAALEIRDGEFSLDLASPSSPGSDASGSTAPPPAIHLQASPTSSASPVSSFRPSPQCTPDRSLDVGDLPDAMELLGPAVVTHASSVLAACGAASDSAPVPAAIPRSLPPLAPGATAADLPMRQLGFRVPSLALDAVPEDGPTGLQILCETARAEALRRTYPSFRNGGGDGASAALSPQRRDRISERVFIQILARRVAAHFAEIGDTVVGERNMRAIRAAAAAHAQECIHGHCSGGGPSCKAAVSAARAVVEETSPCAAVDVSDGTTTLSSS